MPSYVIADMFGIPHEDGVALYNLTEAIHAAPESQAAGAAVNVVMEMFNYVMDAWHARRAEPADDLASVIAHVAVDGNELEVHRLRPLLPAADRRRWRHHANLVAGGLDVVFHHPA